MFIRMYGRLIGYSLILLSAVMFGSYGIWSRLMGDYFAVFYQAYSKSLIILILLLPILLVGRKITAVRREDRTWMGIYLVASSLTLAPMYYAFNHMPVANATLIFYVAMMLTMSVFGFTAFDERLTRTKLVATILGLVGLAVVFSDALTGFVLLASLAAFVN